MDGLREILEELVAIDSQSARPNEPIIVVLERRLTALGFTCERLAYRDANGIAKINLLARAGAHDAPSAPGAAGDNPAGSNRAGRDPAGGNPAGGSPSGAPHDAAAAGTTPVGGSQSAPAALLLVGHTDTVPFDPAWTDALRLTQRDGRLYGRGACDTKGFIACALAAAARVDVRALKAPLAMLFSCDEEIGCEGARWFANKKPIAPRFAIVGEPTRLRPVRAHKGYFLATIDVIGREGHSSLPSAGASAILGAADLIGRIEQLGRELEQDGDPDFAPPYTTLNVGTIEGGRASNVIAGRCRFVVEWRPIPRQSPTRVMDALRSLAAQVAAARGLQIEVQSTRAEPGLGGTADSELVRFLEKASGQASATVPFATEAPMIAGLGAEAVVFGPGDIALAHQTGEYVELEQLSGCTDILEAAIRRFCS